MINQKYVTQCARCRCTTSKKYARAHGGYCKSCVEGAKHPYRGLGNTICEECGRTLNDPIHDLQPPWNPNSREARILEHGYQAYAREEGHYDPGGDE
jgi:hypothetical protein